MGKWFDTSKRGYLLDFQIPDSFDQVPLGQLPTLRNMDPGQIVGQLKDAGVTALYTHARDSCGNCYYDTKVGHKHTGIGDRDLLVEFSRACRKADIAILYYVYLAQSMGPRGSCYAEKDFARVGPDGNPTRDRFLCMNRPGREYIKALLQELGQNYDFDGFWLDSFVWTQGMPICYCDICKAKFLADTRMTLPEPDDNASRAWRRYVRWIGRQNSLVKQELNQAIRAANPQLTVAYNNTLFKVLVPLEEGLRGDYASSEFHYAEGCGQLALDCRKSAALKPGAPFEIEVWRFFMRHDQKKFGEADRRMRRANQVRPVAQLFTEMATVLANGGMIQYYDQLQMDGTVDARSLEMLKGAFTEVRRREPFLSLALERVGYAGVAWSLQTAGYTNDPYKQEQVKAVEGFHFALLEKHVPHGIVTDEMLREGRFEGIQVIILPCLTCLGESEAERLREYVRNGGGIVATHRTSLQDDFGNPRGNFLLADLFGADYLEPLSYRYSFAKFAEAHDLTEGLPLDWPMTVFDECQLKVEPRDTAKGLGHIVHPFRGNHMGYFPGEDTPYPAAVLREVGKGRVVYFPQPLGLCYGKYGHPDTRRLIVNAVRWAAGEAPPIEVVCPDTVEVVLWRSPSGDKQVIHLVNRTAGGPQQSRCAVIHKALPIHDIRLRLRSSIRKAMLQPEGLDLEVVQREGTSEIVVPQLETYSIVIAEE